MWDFQCYREDGHMPCLDPDPPRFILSFPWLLWSAGIRLRPPALFSDALRVPHPTCHTSMAAQFSYEAPSFGYLFKNRFIVIFFSDYKSKWNMLPNKEYQQTQKMQKIYKGDINIQRP